MSEKNEKIILYSSSYCSHSWAVERFVEENEIPIHIINIDSDPGARETVIEINNGYASVPTLVFPDGSTLTEPSFSALRAKLGMEDAGLLSKIRSVFSGK
ncbi:MAG: NrdH-redoxin [Chloroflexi bacterium]|nr:NrdH-redoxin [Chloroflexota bacterium]